MNDRFVHWRRAFWGALIADVFERLRDWRVYTVIILGFVLAILAAWLTATNLRDTINERAIAKQVEETRWSSQGKKNAHSAAHYGIYVFKPLSALATIDPGIERYVGTTVWLEAHKQNEFVFRPANDSLPAARQLPLTPAFILQILAPLAMIFLGFGVFAEEREVGRLRALRMTAAPLSAIGLARASVLWGMGMLLALPGAIAVTAVVMSMSASNPFSDGGLRIAIFAICYALYLALWALVIASVSAWARTTRTALAVLVAIWAMWTLVLPRIAVEIADIVHSLPSAQAFRENMEQALGEPHDPDVEAKYRAAILAQYGVKDVKDLPINWTGISLQRGEEHSDHVFDAHYGALFAGFNAQTRLTNKFGWLSPTIAVSAVASAAAASDMSHHLHFIQRAESHRRMIQKKMNDFITVNPDRDGKRVDGDDTLWNSIPKFTYQFAPLREMSGFASAAKLLILFLLAACIFVWRTRAIARGSLS